MGIAALRSGDQVGLIRQIEHRGQAKFARTGVTGWRIGQQVTKRAMIVARNRTIAAQIICRRTKGDEHLNRSSLRRCRCLLRSRRDAGHRNDKNRSQGQQGVAQVADHCQRIQNCRAICKRLLRRNHADPPHLDARTTTPHYIWKLCRKTTVKAFEN